MLIELMRLAGGGGTELARRWVAALLSVPAEDRRALVEEVEARISEVYALPDSHLGRDDEASPMLHVASEPVQRAGYVEQVIRSYAKAKEPTKKKGGRSSARRRKPSA